MSEAAHQNTIPFDKTEIYAEKRVASAVGINEEAKWDELVDLIKEIFPD